MRCRSIRSNSRETSEAVWAGHRTGTFDGHDTVEFDGEHFSRLPNVSIDYAVMEKAANVACVRAGFDWSDIGSWQALSETLPADADGNRRRGRRCPSARATRRSTRAIGWSRRSASTTW